MNPPTTHSALLVSYTPGFARLLFALWLTLLLLPSPLVRAQAGGGAPAAAQRDAEARTLKVGEPAERELAGGQLLSGQGHSGTGANRELVAKGQPGTAPKESVRTRDYSHPYYWASFIQSGEWANLDGRR
jgi:hypothetical protein